MNKKNKDTLEEMKDWFYADEELHEFQIEWLFEQAEKSIKYAEILNSIQGNYDNQDLDNDLFADEIKRDLENYHFVKDEENNNEKQ